MEETTNLNVSSPLGLPCYLIESHFFFLRYWRSTICWNMSVLTWKISIFNASRTINILSIEKFARLQPGEFWETETGSHESLQQGSSTPGNRRRSTKSRKSKVSTLEENKTSAMSTYDLGVYKMFSYAHLIVCTFNNPCKEVGSIRSSLAKYVQS